MPKADGNHHHHPPQRTGQASAGITTAEHLAEHLAEFACPSMAVVCVGNDLCGDDGVGVLIARELSGQIPWY
ncbi:MAG: hypothetical protein KAX44_08855, partial [Candidatus Brocadiae bacterium]|nr:hypothetical protein [Candidatus Brocadiia bacterium]